MVDFGIGAAVRRNEDFRFLTGQGTYTDDINRPRQLHALLLRSPQCSRGARRHRHGCRQSGARRRRGLYRRRWTSGGLSGRT
jgi:CO/xanthine dehydrogenase Mo-binding subunit